MFSSYLVLALVCGGPVSAEPSAQETAEKELREHGATFKPIGLYVLFLKDAVGLSQAQIEKLGRANIYLTIDKEWSGGREKLKYLRDLPNLKEVVFGPYNFSDDWSEEIAELTQLEGLFFGGGHPDRRDKDLSDRGLASVAKLTNLQALSLIWTNVTDDGLVHVKGLTKLRWLSLSAARKITDKGLAHLKDLKNLEDLNLECTQTTAKGLVHLEGMTKMRRLRLSSEVRPQGQPSGLKYLAGMTELRMLDARGLCADDDELKAVKNMTKLEELNLCYTHITDKGLEHLAGLTALKDLDLFGTGVKGEGLKHLKDLKELKFLNLNFTPLDDSALEHLKKLTGLKELLISNSNMSKKSIEELRQALPNTKIPK